MSNINLDEVLEGLTKKGFSPCLVCDDNGNWAVSDEGYGDILSDTAENGDSFSFTFIGEGSWFKPTIKEAVEDYVNRLYELGNEI